MESGWGTVNVKCEKDICGPVAPFPIEIHLGRGPVTECSPSVCEALGSIPTTKKKKCFNPMMSLGCFRLSGTCAMGSLGAGTVGWLHPQTEPEESSLRLTSGHSALPSVLWWSGCFPEVLQPLVLLA